MFIPESEFTKPFGDFLPFAEGIANRGYYSSLYQNTRELAHAGLFSAALRLLDQLDAPEIIKNIADYRADSQPVQTLTHSIKRGDDSSLDDFLQEIKSEMRKSPDQRAHDALLSQSVNSQSSDLADQVEAEIVFQRAIIRVRLGEDALELGQRLSGITGNAFSQYAAACVFSAQGRREDALAALETVVQLEHRETFPDVTYFDAVRDSLPFRTLKLSGMLTHQYRDLLPFASLSEEQTSVLLERAYSVASVDYASAMVQILSYYVMRKIDSNEFGYAESAAKKAIEIDNKSDVSLELNGLVLNRTGRFEEAAGLLLGSEGYLGASGVLELAVALIGTGKPAEAFPRLKLALEAAPFLYSWLKEEPAYAPLQQLSSQPGFTMLMAEMDALSSSAPPNRN